MGKRPSFQFYPGDWLRDPELRLCSLQAKGAWMDALCLAFACAEKGVFATNGRPWTREQLARAVGCDVEIIDELIDNGVARIREEDGAIYCSRMVKDEETRRLKALAGSKGGRTTQAEREQTAKQNASKTQANGQAKSGSSSSSSSSTSVTDPPPKPPSGGQGQESKAPKFRAEDVTLPDVLDTPEFRRAWLEWCDYRRQARKAITLAACTKQLKTLARAGPDVGIQAIEMSIQNDWQGIFPERVRGRRGQQSSLREIAAWGEGSSDDEG